MKINEVEALVGIPKKNIRFYESEGLLKPERSSCGGLSCCESWGSPWRRSERCKAAPTPWATACAGI